MRKLNEDIYSTDIRQFIRLSKKTESMTIEKRLPILLKYLTDNFRNLSNGQFRTAFRSRKGEIVKIAHKLENVGRFESQPSPMEQNKSEIKLFNEPNIDIFPKVEAYDSKDYLWFIVEKVRPFYTDQMGKIFPKYVSMLKNWYKLVGERPLQDSETFWILEDLQVFIDQIIWKNPASSQQRMSKLLNHIIPYEIWNNLDDPEIQILHKKMMNELYEYLKNPDPNFAAMRKAMRDYGVDYQDLHAGNLGTDENYNLKIIDAGWKTDKLSETSFKQIHENFNKFLNEDIYSTDMRNFIRFSEKTKKMDSSRRVRAIFNFIDDWKPMGCGSFRCVFQSPGGEIIKVVKPTNQAFIDRNIDMNKLEVEKFNRQDIEAFPRIEEVDSDYLWFVVEKINVLSHDKAGALPQLFPKLYKILSPVFGGNSKIMEELLNLMLQYKSKVESDASKLTVKKYDERGNTKFYKFVKYIDLEFKLSMKNVSQEQWKQLYENLFHYMNNGDINFRRLIRAVDEANVDPVDLGFGNLGYSDDGVIKIIDAGF